MHVRKQLRDAIATVVANTIEELTKLDVNETNVNLDQLPAFRVIARNERLEADALGDAGADRTIEARVIINAETTDNLDDVLDDYAVLLEPAILQDPDLASLCETLDYSSSEIASSGIGQSVSGAIEIVFLAVIQTAKDDPTKVET